MSYLDLFSIVSKLWASVYEIQQVGNCGRDKAVEIRNFIKQAIKDNGKKVPSGKIKVVPMTRVIEYFDLDINYISKIAMDTIIEWKDIMNNKTFKRKGKKSVKNNNKKRTIIKL